MKKIIRTIICLILTSGLFGILSMRLIQRDASMCYQRTDLPAAFPSANSLIVIWFVVFTLLGIAAARISLNPIAIRRRKNALMDFAILLATYYAWNFLVFGIGNFIGAAAMAGTALILGLIVCLMFLLIDRYAGYLSFPAILWSGICLYYAIAMAIV